MAAETEPVAHVPVMADVARVAGVSHQTVSRVINGSPNIRPSTRERVEAAIEQLGYRPNLAARALVTRRTHMIGVVVTGGGEYGPSSIQRSVEAAARQAGYFVSAVSLSEVTRCQPCPTPSTTCCASRSRASSSSPPSGRRSTWSSERDPGVPLVVVEGDLSAGPFAVGVDQARGAYEATTAPRRARPHAHRARVRAARAGPRPRPARRAGARRSPTPGCCPARCCAATGRPPAATRSGCQLATEPDVTAVFSANDQTAIGLLRAFHENGRTVPDDVSVVGFDDTPEAAFLVPPLTTVRQEFPLVGRRAIDVLHAAITGQRGRAGPPHRPRPRRPRQHRPGTPHPGGDPLSPSATYVVGVDFGTLSGRALVVRGRRTGRSSRGPSTATRTPSSPTRSRATRDAGCRPTGRCRFRPTTSTC